MALRDRTRGRKTYSFTRSQPIRDPATGKDKTRMKKTYSFYRTPPVTTNH